MLILNEPILNIQTTYTTVTCIVYLATLGEEVAMELDGRPIPRRFKISKSSSSSTKRSTGSFEVGEISEKMAVIRF